MKASMHRELPLVALLLALVLAAGCQGVDEDDDGIPGGGQDAGSGDTDTDTDADSDADADGDSDADSDADSDTEEVGVIEMDCSGCSGVGSTLDDMICAIDLCDPSVLSEADYYSLVNLTSCTLEDTYEAVAHFGDPTNMLAPKLNDNYALMASGPAEGTSHTTPCDDGSAQLTDPYVDPEYETYDIHDVMEWRMVLTAPEEAEAFRFKYVFFSEEYDEFIASSFNDKFYVILEAGSTNGGEPTVINFTECRDPSSYVDFECGPDDAGCEEGLEYCFIAINTSLSECCWYNGCPDGTWTTDISGTGFSCAADQGSDSSGTGSSTGWLQTSWPIEAGETFAITFHIHDTSDGILDSEVIIDAFEFLTTEQQGTVDIE